MKHFVFPVEVKLYFLQEPPWLGLFALRMKINVSPSDA